MIGRGIKKFIGYILIASFIVVSLTMHLSSIDNNVTMENLTSFLSIDETNEHEYHSHTSSHRYDCGYFSIDLARNASKYNMNLGIAVLDIECSEDYHAINYAYINKTIIFIEPQTDGIYNASEMLDMGYSSAKLIPWRTPTAKLISYKADIFF